jgi:hypothetical protein
MKKRKLGAIIVVSILIILVIFILLPSPIQNIIIPSTEESENETRTPFRFTFPWQTSATQEGGGGAAGAGEGGSGSGGGGEGGETENITEVIIPKQTLNIDSFGEGLRIYVNYSFDENSTDITIHAPYSLEIDKNSITCVLPDYITGTGKLKWTLDGNDCEFSICKNSMGEDSSYGCKILMDNDHSVMLYYTPTE